MFGFQKKKPAQSYDPAEKEPVIRASICTGEQVAGFRDKRTNQFTEVMLLRDRRDLDEFLRAYGVEERDIKRIW